MKKILFLMLLTFTTFANADGRYTMVVEEKNDLGGVWIIDHKMNEIKYCFENEFRVNCTYWQTLDKAERNERN